MMKFDQLNELLMYATDPVRGSFYRNLYGMRDHDPALCVQSLEQWRQLPFVSKDDLTTQPLNKRSFLPLSKLDHLRASSGTSGKPPLFSPRTKVRSMGYRLELHDFTRPFMAYTVPMMPHWHERFQAEHGRCPGVVVYDPKHPAASIRLAKDAGIDAFSVFVYHVHDIGEEMKKYNLHKQIRFIEITGEVCTRAQYEYIRATFPNAKIFQSYNSSEVEDAHVGIPCREITGEDPLAVYHPKATHYLELIDPDTGSTVEPKKGAEGDLLITACPGEPASFPLIRFRIGDTVRVVDEHCPHGSWSFTVLGRTDMDFLKIPGGVLRADEIARVLRLFPAIVTDRFELRCAEEVTENGSILTPTLYVELRQTTNVNELARNISKHLRVAPAFTYENGVEKNRYKALKCEALKGPIGGKMRRIVRD